LAAGGAGGDHVRLWDVTDLLYADAIVETVVGSHAAVALLALLSTGAILLLRFRRA
jgi:hypothetical protein